MPELRSQSRRFLSGVRFLTTLGVGVGFFCPTPYVQLDHFLHHTSKLGIPVEMVQFPFNAIRYFLVRATQHFPAVSKSSFESACAICNK